MSSKERETNILVEKSDSKVTMVTEKAETEIEIFSSLEEAGSKKKMEKIKEIAARVIFGGSSAGQLTAGGALIYLGVKDDNIALVGFGVAFAGGGLLLFNYISRQIDKTRLVTKQIEKVKSAIESSQSDRTQNI